MEKNNALVVDDDRAFGELLGDLLLEKGFDVRCCRSGKEALETAELMHFRVIITDYRMPGMYGTEVARAMRRRFPAAFIIGISMSCKEQEFIAAGADAFLPKPFEIGELMSLLKRFAPENRTGNKEDRGPACDIPEKA